jgi:hypothetical protein
MWIFDNPNPCRREEPDCVVRAIAIATGKTWDEVHWDLCRLSHEHCTMPSVNWLWEMYLKRNGFEKFLLPDACPECVTVREFCKRYPDGTYVIGTGTHAIAVISGNYVDAWDSGGETPTYFFRKRGT